eukprot:g20548.t1
MSRVWFVFDLIVSLFCSSLSAALPASLFAVSCQALDNARESGFEEEVRVLSMFRHPNLVVLMGFARNGPKRFLVYELMEGGDLFNRIHYKKQKAFEWRERICVAYDAACGLSHLHHQTPKVFHRDIKSPNILLTRSGLAKVADFGLTPRLTYGLSDYVFGLSSWDLAVRTCSRIKAWHGFAKKVKERNGSRTLGAPQATCVLFMRRRK